MPSRPRVERVVRARRRDVDSQALRAGSNRVEFATPAIHDTAKPDFRLQAFRQPNRRNGQRARSPRCDFFAPGALSHASVKP